MLLVEKSCFRTLFACRKTTAVETANEEEELESDGEGTKDSTKLLKEYEDNSMYEKKLKSMEQEQEMELDSGTEMKKRDFNRKYLCCGAVVRGLKKTALFSLVRYVL